MKNEFYAFSDKRQKFCWIALTIGLIALGASFYFNPLQAWTNILINNFYFVSLALAGLFFVALQGVVKTSWMTPYKRVPEAMIKFLPVGFALMLIMVAGIHSLYEWSHHEVVVNDPLLMKKNGLLKYQLFCDSFGCVLLIVDIIWKNFSFSFSKNG